MDSKGSDKEPFIVMPSKCSAGHDIDPSMVGAMRGEYKEIGNKRYGMFLCYQCRNENHPLGKMHLVSFHKVLMTEPTLHGLVWMRLSIDRMVKAVYAVADDQKREVNDKEIKALENLFRTLHAIDDQFTSSMFKSGHLYAQKINDEEALVQFNPSPYDHNKIGMN